MILATLSLIAFDALLGYLTRNTMYLRMYMHYLCPFIITFGFFKRSRIVDNKIVQII